MASKRNFSQGGFTLLETLVALAVLAISLGVIYQIFGTSLRNMQYAKDYSTAQMLAESKMSELGKGIPLREGEFEGQFNDKYIWHMDVTPLPFADDDGGNELKKLKVDFSVLWESDNKKRSVNIRTFRLAVEDL